MAFAPVWQPSVAAALLTPAALKAASVFALKKQLLVSSRQSLALKKAVLAFLLMAGDWRLETQ